MEAEVIAPSNFATIQALRAIAALLVVAITVVLGSLMSGLDTTLKDGDEVSIIPALAGGQAALAGGQARRLAGGACRGE